MRCLHFDRMSCISLTNLHIEGETERYGDRNKHTSRRIYHLKNRLNHLLKMDLILSECTMVCNQLKCGLIELEPQEVDNVIAIIKYSYATVPNDDINEYVIDLWR